jgi:serine/threonine protein phosphatase PrpC
VSDRDGGLPPRLVDGVQEPTGDADCSDPFASPREGSGPTRGGAAGGSRFDANDRPHSSRARVSMQVGADEVTRAQPDQASPATAPPGGSDEVGGDELIGAGLAESGTATGVHPGRQTEVNSGSLQSLEWAPGIGNEGHQREIQPSIGDATVGVSDTEVEFVTVPPFEIRACATRGWSHRQSGAPRQDFFAIAASGEWLFAAVADGVSSGPHSDVAALTAARAATRLALMETDIPSIDWLRLCDRLSWRIVEEAKYRQLVGVDDDADASARVLAVREVMSTTAVVVALRRRVDDDGRHQGVLALLAGDSAAYRLSGAMVTPLLGGKDEDGYLTSGRVHPLPGARSPIATKFALEKGQGVLLTSDGLSDPLGDGTGEVARVLGQRWSEPPSPVDFFADLNFLRRSFDDDRTAVGIWA